MKKIFTLLFMIISLALSAQQEIHQQMSPNGIFDEVFDLYGNSYSLQEIRVDTRPDSLGKPKASLLCTGGYFDLYFEANCGMDGNTQVELDRRNVLCQLFSDLSQFINPANPNVRVNIWVRDIANITTNPSVLGVASGFYTVPSNAPTFSGIADNEIWKTINSGTDSYTNVTAPLNTLGGPSASFYHGIIAFNFSTPSINWHTDLTLPTQTGLYDMYSIALHEVTHALGFASLIGSTGNSKLGANYQYYSRFDLNLNTSNNVPLITNTGSCSLYNYGFNTLLNPNVLIPNPFNCATHIKYNGTVNQAVYTPLVFANESSLSHFEDQCHLPNAYPDNEYYVMSEANGSGVTYMKRFLKPEERSVLCDIGYNVNGIYGNSTNLTFYNYNSGTCPGLQVAGINDGINNNSTFTYVTTVGFPILVNGVLGNDFNATSFECLQDIYGNGNPSVTSGTSFTYTPTTSGLALLRYIPVAANGNRGNITYILILVQPVGGNCNYTACNLIPNGGFENVTSNCGQTGLTDSRLDCWSVYVNSPDLYGRNCGGTYDLPGGYNIPPSDTWDNGANNNNHFLGMFVATIGPWGEATQVTLSTGLVNGNSYQLRFWARVSNNYGTHNNPFILSVVATPAPLQLPGSIFVSTDAWLTPIIPQISIPLNNQWNYIVQNFTYNGPNGLSNFIIGSDPVLASPNSILYCLIDDIELLPASSASSFNPPTIVCQNQTLPNLALYATPSGGVFTGNGVTVSAGIYSFDPTVSGPGNHLITYTYTNNAGCTLSTFATIMVSNSNINLNSTATPTDICPGSSSTLNATGANTYVWNPGNFNGNPYLVSPTVTTAYTVTGTSPFGCISTSQITVNVFPPIPPTISTIPTICSGESVDLSPFVSPASGVFSGTGVTPTGIFSNTSGSYSITYTYTDINGCHSSSTFNINVTNNCCIASTIVPSTGASSSSYGLNFSTVDIAVNGNLTIDNNFNVSSQKLLFAPNIKIIILPGKSLTIDYSQLYSCSNQMWDGIEIQPGGNLIITNLTLIEDAKVAVLSDNTGGQIASFKIDQTTFNRNYIGIKVINFNTGGIHSGSIRSCTFDSHSSITSTNNTSLLDAPYNNQTAEFGVELYNTNNINIGDASQAIFKNSFRYLRIGIRSQYSNYNVYNNEFRNNFPTTMCAVPIPTPPGFTCPFVGWAIWNTKTTCIVGGNLANQSNTFKDLSNGIMHEKGTYLDVINNTFTNITTSSQFIISIAVFTKDFSAGTINISNNNLKDLETGLSHRNSIIATYNVQNNLFKNFNAYAIYAYQNTNGTISILQNDFNWNASNTLYTGNNGIYVSNAVLPLTSSPNVIIENNTIFKINKGIYLIDIDKSIVRYNTIGFKNSITPLSPNYYFGIRTQNCRGEYIYQNTVYKNGPVPTTLYENSVYGISVESNIDYVFTLENSVQKMGRGLRFRSYNNAQSRVRCNIMTQNWAGLTLDAVNIGQQGQPISLSFPLGDASDNQWSAIPSNMTGSVSVRGLPGYTSVPFYTRGASWPWCPPAINIIPSWSIITSSNTPQPIVNLAPQNCTNICYSPPCNYQIQAKIAQNQSPFNLVTGNSRFMMQQDLLKTLLADSTIDTDTSTDAIILKYYRDTTLANTNMGIIATVSSKYAGGDTLGAEALNLTIDPKQCADMYHKIVNKIFFSTWARNIFYFSPSDSLILHDIAIQDPLICGTAIYDARVMMGIDVNDFSVDNNNKSANINPDDNTVTDNIGQLYPNPSQNIVYYETQLNDNESGILLIYDAIGNQVMAQQLDAGYNKLNIDVSKLSNGLYLYRLCINGEFKEKNKFIIQR